MKPIVAFGRLIGIRCFHRHAEWFDQLAILHARGASGFAGAAIEAKFQMSPHRWFEFEASFGYCPHEMDTTARSVIFIPRFQIGGAARGTKPAMDAVQKELEIDLLARILFWHLSGVRHDCR